MMKLKMMNIATVNYGDTTMLPCVPKIKRFIIKINGSSIEFILVYFLAELDLEAPNDAN